jgi:hypothetical protein
MKAILKTQTLPSNLLVILTLALALSYGCTSNPNSSSETSDSGKTKLVADTAGNAVPRNPGGMSLIRGTVINTTSKKINIKTKDSTQTILLAGSLHLYAASPGSLADVKNTSFIGVTTQKQADQSDRATEIHIFPEELRGLGEGSFIMDPQTGTGSRMTNGSASRMTNGAASRMTNGSASRMTNGAASRMTNGSASRMTNGSASRMTNGQAQKTDGSSLVIQYQGKSRTVKVPANTPVTAYKVTNQKLSPGNEVVALVKKDTKGNYTTDKILIRK